MAPGKEPITQSNMKLVHGEIASLREFLLNEFKHLRADVNDNTDWRVWFSGEEGPWRKMDKRVADLEYFAADMKETVDHASKLFYGVLTAVLIWAVIEIITALPKLAALLQGGP